MHYSCCRHLRQRCMTLLTALVLGMLIAGCTTGGQRGDFSHPVEVGGSYGGPSPQIAIEPGENQSIIHYQITVPTGGWNWRLIDIAHQNGRINLYTELVRPGPDEIVTQALETIEKTFSDGNEYHTAVLYIRQTQRNTTPTEAHYARAASAP